MKNRRQSYSEEATDANSRETKVVRNRNDYKVELLIEGEVVVFPPRSCVEIAKSFDVPANLGLYVR